MLYICRYVIMLGWALVLATIGVIIAFLGEKACLSRQCVGQAKFIDRSMDTDIDPCDDFYSFVCGNFRKYGTSIIDSIELRQLNRLIEYLSVPADWDKDDRIEHIAKTLYQNCINDTQLNIEGSPPIERVLAKIGGIPFLDPLWEYERKAEFDIFGNDLKHFFNGLNPLFVETRIIRIKTLPLVRPKNETPEEKKKHLYHAFAIPPHLYYTIPPTPENYLAYCMGFNEIYSKELQTHKNVTEQEKREIIEAANFKINFTKIIDWSRNCSDQPFLIEEYPYEKQFGRPGGYQPQLSEYIKRKAEPGTTTPSFVIKTPNFEKYIDKLNELFTHVTDRALTTYMGVEALIQMTPFLPPAYRTLYDKYMKSERDKQNLVVSNRKHLCAKCVQDAMTVALTAQYLKQKPKPAPGIQEFNFLSMQLLQEVKNILKRIKWPTKRDRLKMLKFVSNLTIATPLPDDIIFQLTQEKEFDLFYMIMCIVEDSTLESYLAVKVVREIRNAQLLNQASADLKVLPYTIFHEDYDMFNVDIYFQEDSNTVIVPTAYMYYPAIDTLWPKYLSFGGLAVWIAHLIMKTVGYDNILHPMLRPTAEQYYDQSVTPEPEGPPWWTDDTTFRYEKQRKCALKDYNDYLNQFHITCTDPNCLEETLYYSAAVQVAFYAYKESVRTRFFREPRIPYLTRYTVDQIFFIKFASSFCEYQGPEKMYVKNTDSKTVSSNFTVMYSLRNLPEFQKTFHCNNDQNMYKSDPCHLWPSVPTE